MKNITKDVLLYATIESAAETAGLFLGTLVSKKVQVDLSDPIILMILNVVSEAKLIFAKDSKTPIYIAVGYALASSLVNMNSINVKSITIKTVIVAAIAYLEGYMNYNINIKI